jgi:hypothetical protein
MVGFALGGFRFRSTHPTITLITLITLTINHLSVDDWHFQVM